MYEYPYFVANKFIEEKEKIMIFLLIINYLLIRLAK